MGRPGTEAFLQGQQQAVAAQLEALRPASPPGPRKGRVLPADLRRELAAEDIQFGRRERQIEALREQGQSATRAAREALAEQKREAREFEQQLKGERQERTRRYRSLWYHASPPEEEQNLKAQAQAQKQRIQEFARGARCL